MRQMINSSRRLLAAMLVLTAGCNNLDRYGESESLNPPSNLAAVPASASAIALTWEAPAAVEGKITYRLFRNGVEFSSTTGTSHQDGSLTPSTMYLYMVSAVDRFGNISPPSSVASAMTLPDGVTDTDPPSVPINLVAVPATSSSIALSWTPSTDAVGVLGYRIFRDGTQIAVVSATTFTNLGLAAGTEYTYTVAAYDGAGNVSAQSDPAAATTLASGETDTEAPSVPTGLVATAPSPNTVSLTWNPSTDNIGVISYDIYRNGTLIGTSPTTSYTDTGLCAATGFSYTVAARDGAGNVSAQSAPASVITLNVVIDLGTAGNFSVLAGSGLGLGGILPSLISGNVGTSPGTSLLGPLLNIVGGVLHSANSTSAAAQVDLGLAKASLSTQPVCSGDNLSGQNLGGLTLDAGVYGFSSNAALTGTLTLDAEGDPNAVFVIKVPGTLTVANNATVALTGGAQAQNVYWDIGTSANVGSSATVRGNLLAGSSVNLGLSTEIEGRALAQTGAVSMLLNTIGLLIP